MKQLFPLLLVLIFFQTTGCQKDETPVEQEQPEPQQTEETPPEITVNGVSDNIETFTEITVTIKDESSTETAVQLDGETLFSSSQKQFSYQLNPYPISVGPHSLRVLSTDGQGNENSKTFEIVVKHLLMSYDYGAQENERNPFKWLFFNDLDGTELVNYRAVPGVKKIYTDQIVKNNTIYYSIANYTFNPDYLNSQNLLVTTNKITLGRNRAPITIIEFPDLQNELSITINMQEPSNGLSSYWSAGSEYRVAYTSQGSGGYLEELGIIFDDTEVVYTRKVGATGVAFLDGEPEDYKYLSFPTTPGYSETTVGENDFISPGSYNVITLPDHEAGTMQVRRYGYDTQEAIETNTNHLIYEALENFDYAAQSIDLPILEGLQYYRNNMRYRQDGKWYETEGFDGHLDLNMPNWSLSSNIDSDQMSLTANNPAVDIYIIQFKKDINLGTENELRMTWNYRIFGNTDEDKSAPRLMIPSEITDAIGENFYKDLSDLSLRQINAIDYDEFSSFQEIMDWFAFIQINPTIDQTGYRQISFPLPSTSRTSRKVTVKETSFEGILDMQ